MLKVKVLHLIDIAGIASIISYYQNKHDVEKSNLFFHKKNDFSSTISNYYEGKSFKKFKKLLFSSLSQKNNYDIIHIHSAEYLVPIFKIFGKKVVLHYHGTDIRKPKNSLDKKKIFCRSLADMIIYNAENMLPKIITFRDIKKRYLPNPIDTALFRFTNNKKKRCISYISTSLDKEKTIGAIQDVMETEIIDPSNQQIPYPMMTKLLSKYETYLDIRITPWEQTLDELSTTALQALACGCRVFHNQKFISDFPQKHDPKSVIEKLHSYYSEILK